MYNLYREPWLVAKLDAMLGDVFGQQPAAASSSDRPRRSWPPVPRSTRWPAGQPPGDTVDAVPDVG